MTAEQRRLATIIPADVAKYSRLMGRDESGTLAAALGQRALSCPIVINTPCRTHCWQLMRDGSATVDRHFSERLAHRRTAAPHQDP